MEEVKEDVSRTFGLEDEAERKTTQGEPETLRGRDISL